MQNTNYNNVDCLTDFVKTQEFDKLKQWGEKIYVDKTQFNIIDFFQSNFNENAWSDIFSYLLNSKKDHSLQQSFLRKLLFNVDNEEIKRFKKKLPLSSNSETVTVREWLTDDGRRIDIMVLVKDKTNKTHSVVGIENKLDSKEGDNQLMDYQNAIAKRYSTCENKILLFLTPDGRTGETSDDNKDCQCISVSYESIIKVCGEILKESPDQSVEYLIRSMKSYIETMINTENMNAEISNLVKQIYKDKENREAIKLLINYRPNIENVFEELEKKCSKWNKFYICCHESSKTTEFKLHTSNLDILSEELNIGFCYMLHFDGGNPDIGDEFILRLFMQVDKSKLSKEDIRELQEYFEFGESLNEKKDWWEWKTIWTGDSYILKDLDDKDVEGMFRVLESGIEETYEKLKKKINNYKINKL